MGKCAPFVVVCLVALAWARPGVAGAPGIHGRICDASGLPLPGAIVAVAAPSSPTRTTVADAQGEYGMSLPPGRYAVTVSLSGFDDAHHEVVVADGQTAVLDIVLAVASHREDVTVRAAAPPPIIGEAAPAAPVTATREIIDSGMLFNNQAEDVLPLLPNVVRGPDGLISVAGARAPQGALFVNGFNETDPITGDPGLFLALEAVDALDVFSGAYSAELGRATGGVTAIRTRPGADTLHMSASSFFPRMRFTGGRLNGVDSWEPNAGLSGPVVKGRLWYEGAVSYRFDRNRFGTLVGEQNQVFSALSTWSQIDAQVSPGQHVSLSFAFVPQRIDHAHITAFTPSASVPGVDRTAWSGSLGDRVTVGDRTTLELRAGVLSTHESITPDGTAPYVVSHDLVQGSYFDRQQERGLRGEAAVVWTRTLGTAHLVRAGANLDRSTLNGTDTSGPVSFLRDDGSLSRLVTFPGAASLRAAQDEGALFVQDLWTVSSRLSVDAGVRYDRATEIGGAVSPRVAWTLKWPGVDSTIGGSIGVFTDKLPLDALAFPGFAPRVIQLYDGQGNPAGVPQRLVGVLSGPLVTPSATRWDLEFDRSLSRAWKLRLKYEERDGRHEPIVVSEAVSESVGVLALSTTGASRSRSMEITAAYHAAGGNEICLSYVRSATRGDSNSFDAIEGELREPFVQVNGVGPLPADVPNRLLAWGVVHLPWRLTVAPFLEVRDGFPYSTINGDWLLVGGPNSQRLPAFAALDLYVHKIFHLPYHLPEARIGVKVYNLAAIHSERDVQRDITRLDFGTTYNPIPRDVTGVLELLWGKR